MTFLQHKYYQSFISQEKVEQLLQNDIGDQLETLCDYAALTSICSVLSETERIEFLEMLQTAPTPEAVQQWLLVNAPDSQTTLTEALERTLFLVETICQTP